MSDKKYILMPGYITSKNDGDVHFINSHQLIKLYGVKREECIFGDNLKNGVNRGFIQPNNLIILSPRYDGNYDKK